MVHVRKMRPGEAETLKRTALNAGPRGSPLLEAVAGHPERVRVAEMGGEVLGAFVLTELQGGVEELSGMNINEEGRKTGAEGAIIEYVVHAARFGGKRAIEVVAETGSAEARRLEAEGFEPKDEPRAGEKRYRMNLKKVRAR